MSKRGFVIVEVLVAFIILTTTMSLLTYAQKNFNENVKRLQKYENTFTTLLSLKNKIDIEMMLGDKKHYEGKLNKINYRIDMKKVKEGMDLSYDSMAGTYTEGIHSFMLYEVKVKLYELGKTFTFYKLKTYFDEALVQEHLNEL